MARREESEGSIRTPLAVCVVLVALLGAGAAVSGGASSSSSAAAAPKAADVPTIARRVERIRGIRFDEIPRPKTVTGAEAKREGLADFDRTYPVKERRADEELYKLLGLLEPDVDLRAVVSSVFGEQVAGYYDPRSGALRVVDNGALPNRVVEETTLAHELDHALEDQVFDLRLDDLEASGDESLAYSALVEGSATALMGEYQRRHFRPEEAFGGIAASAFGAPSTANLPPFVTAQLLFPYVDGEVFVSRLFETGGDSWKLVDVAEKARPPVSTEQILHPDKYLQVEQPRRVAVEGVGRTLGDGWSRVADGTFGEWQTREFLARAGGTGARDAAAGWGGDRYELWRRGSISSSECRAPCVARDVLVMRWAWDTPRDAAEFRAALDGAMTSGLGARAVGANDWSLRGGAVAVAPRGGREITVAFAPRAAVARRLARGG